MKTLPTFFLAVASFTQWTPAAKTLDTQFWIAVPTNSGDLDMRPVFLTPRNIETACAKWSPGKVTYNDEGDGNFVLNCEVTPTKESPLNRLHFHFYTVPGSIGLGAIFQSSAEQKPAFIGDENVSDIIKFLRDKFLQEGVIQKIPEGRDAFSAAFRWCKTTNDINCMPED